MFKNVVLTAKYIIQSVDEWDDSVMPLLGKIVSNENCPAVVKQAVSIIKKWEPAIIENGKKFLDFIDGILGAEESGEKGAKKLEIATKKVLDAGVPEELKKMVDLSLIEVNKDAPAYMATITKIDSLVSSVNSVVKSVSGKKEEEEGILDMVQDVTEKASDVMNFINSFFKKV